MTNEDSLSKNRQPQCYADSPNLSPVDKALIVNLELCETEFNRYKRLDSHKKASIIELLNKRKQMNDFVKNYLEEEINKPFGSLKQWLLPTEHSLRYALQKVDESEDAINTQLSDEKLHLFDEKTTKRNRLEILYRIACHHYQALKKQITTAGEGNDSELNQQKLADLNAIIEELDLELKNSEYYLHNEDLLNIKDIELSAFINKLKIIGITGFHPVKDNKYQPTFFAVSIISFIYQKLNTKPDPESDDDTNNSPEP